MSIGMTKPPEQAVAAPLQAGDTAPGLPGVDLSQKKLHLVAFLRHGGCPFAEATVKALRQWAETHPDMGFVLVTHGDATETTQWLDSIGGAGSALHVHDADRQFYGQWGIGYSPRTHFVNPVTLFGVLKLLFAGIHNRPDTGTRWQRASAFLVDSHGNVLWAHIPRRAHELPDLDDALLASKLAA